MAQSISVKRRLQNSKHAFLTFMLALLLLFSSISVYADDSSDLSNYFTRSNTITTLTFDGNSVTVKGGGYSAAGADFNLTGSSITVAFDYVSNTTYRENFLSFNGEYDVSVTGDVSAISSTNYANTADSGHVEFTMSAHAVQFPSWLNKPFRIGSTGSSNGGSGDNQCIFTFTTLQVDDLAIVDSSAWSGPATVSVEAGCVAYILVDGGTATLTTTFPELSKLSRPLWVSGSTYSFENDLPASGKVFSSNSGTLIDWLIPASAKTDLLGRSYQGGRPLSDLPSGQFLVVYNPVYRGYDDKGVGIMSPTIYVSLSNYGAVRQYRLTASYNGGLIESTSDDGYSSWFDSIGEEELDANGNPIYIEHLSNGTTQSAISIPSGGGNIVINGDNADNSIGGLLERLLSLLTAPIRYIERLYNSAIQFFDYLSSLWGWLPVEVTSIIAAALAVLVVIGVVKFLWK